MRQIHKRLLGIGIGLLVLLGAFGMRAADDLQPIQYNHKIHVQDVGLECQDCHQNAATHARALIPDSAFCGDCHDDVDAENEGTREVARYVARGERIPWRTVHVVPDHVYFSHRRHVTVARIECMVCHGNVEEREQPFSAPYRVIEMEWCLDCHARSEASADCYACHR